MKLLKNIIHPSIDSIDNKSIWERPATRGIILRNSDILLLFTERYDDYSLPGGGVDPNESIESGLVRELEEETGARNIRDLKEFGKYEEYRPCHKPEYDLIFMTSYCFTCSIDKQLGDTKYEDYEKKNGMKPVWIDINEAIKHNKKTLAHSSKSGLSIEREIFLLELIRDQFSFS
jgi:8-oxo-dGTP pyrophosphatase MutT (NUDIX family)